jgi:hypothetical protein
MYHLFFAKEPYEAAEREKRWKKDYLLPNL